jgi:hypothetical protein
MASTHDQLAQTHFDDLVLIFFLGVRSHQQFDSRQKA